MIEAGNNDCVMDKKGTIDLNTIGFYAELAGEISGLLHAIQWGKGWARFKALAEELGETAHPPALICDTRFLTSTVKVLENLIRNYKTLHAYYVRLSTIPPGAVERVRVPVAGAAPAPRVGGRTCAVPAAAKKQQYTTVERSRTMRNTEEEEAYFFVQRLEDYNWVFNLLATYDFLSHLSAVSLFVQSPKRLPWEVLEREEQLVTLLGEIFMACVGGAEQAKLLPSKRSDDPLGKLLPEHFPGLHFKAKP